MKTKLDDKFLESIRRLKIIIQKKVKSNVIGDEITKTKSGADDFLGHRGYSHGDEIRYIDWNVYGRLGNLYIKEMSRQENPEILLLIDNSASMFYPPQKIEFAKIVCASLGFISYSSWKRVYIKGIDTSLFLVTQANGFFSIYDYLQNIKQADNATSITKLAKNFSLIIFISDLWFSKPDLASLVNLLRSSQDMCIIHILSKDEIQPDFSGKILFIDSETKKSYENFITPEEVKLYKQYLEEHFSMVKEFCYSHFIRYAFLTIDISLQEAIFVRLSKAGILS